MTECPRLTQVRAVLAARRGPPVPVLYRSNNKLYAVNDQMIQDKMLEEHAKSWIQ